MQAGRCPQSGRRGIGRRRRRVSLERARELYRKSAKNPRTLDDFLRYRREEAEREDARFDRMRE